MANPLTLIMALKDDLELKSIEHVLKQQEGAISQALTLLGTVHFARLVVLDVSAADLQPSDASKGPYKLAVIMAYDGDFAWFIKDFANYVGPALDKLLALTSDGAALRPVKDHVSEFSSYVAANDASQHTPNDGLKMYGAYSYPVEQIVAEMPT